MPGPVSRTTKADSTIRSQALEYAFALHPDSEPEEIVRAADLYLKFIIGPEEQPKTEDPIKAKETVEG